MLNSKQYFRVYYVPELFIYNLTGSLQQPYKVGTHKRRLEQVTQAACLQSTHYPHPTLPPTVHVTMLE